MEFPMTRRSRPAFFFASVAVLLFFALSATSAFASSFAVPQDTAYVWATGTNPKYSVIGPLQQTGGFTSIYGYTSDDAKIFAVGVNPIAYVDASSTSRYYGAGQEIASYAGITYYLDPTLDENFPVQNQLVIKLAGIITLEDSVNTADVTESASGYVRVLDYTTGTQLAFFDPVGPGETPYSQTITLSPTDLIEVQIAVGALAGATNDAYANASALADPQFTVETPGYSLVYSAGLTSFDTSTTPLPATLPLFAGGIGLVGYLASRRKRVLAA
jgi:hypothetical protein